MEDAVQMGQQEDGGPWGRLGGGGMASRVGTEGQEPGHGQGTAVRSRRQLDARFEARGREGSSKEACSRQEQQPHSAGGRRQQPQQYAQGVLQGKAWGTLSWGCCRLGAEEVLLHAWCTRASWHAALVLRL